MNEKQNIIITGSAMLVAGALLLARSGREQSSLTESSPGCRKCPSCAEIVREEAKVCRYCQRNLLSMSEIRAVQEEQRARLAATDKLSKELARRAEASLPKGTCPNCQNTISLASRECRHCSAIFDVGSSWKVKPLREA
jgi:hypothetical protein